MVCDISKLDSELASLILDGNEIASNNDVETFLEWELEYRRVENTRDSMIKKVKPNWYKAAGTLSGYPKSERINADSIYAHFSKWEKTTGGCCYWCRLKFYENWRLQSK